MKTLHYIPIPIPGESPTSICKRLAMHNGYSNCSKFVAYHFGSTEQKISPLLQGGRFEKFIATQIQGPIGDCIRNGFYQRKDSLIPSGSLFINEVEISRRLLRPSEAALCTECINEGWERNIKDICFTIHCPEHNRLYLFNCPDCNRVLTWLNQSGSLCTCGAKLESPHVSWEDSWPERAIQEILNHKDQEKFDFIIKIICNLGAWKSKIKLTCDRYYVIAATALVFENLERAALAFSHIIDSTSALEVEILAAKLAPLVDTTSLNKLFNIVKSLPPPQHKPLKTITILAKYMPKFLGISIKQWAHVCRSQAYKSLFIRHSGRAPFTKDEAEILKDLIKKNSDVIKACSPQEDGILNKYYSKEEVLQIIDIPVRDLDIICKQGIFNPTIKVECYRYYSRDAVNLFNSTFIKVRDVSTEFGFSIPKIRTAIRLSNSNIDYVNNFSGNPLFLRRDHLPALQEKMSMAPKMRRTKITRRVYITTQENTMHIKKAAEYLGINEYTLQLYRDLGAITCNPDHPQLVSVASVKKFYRDYATPKTLGRELEIPYNKVAHLLEPLGVFPISGPNLDGQIFTLYARSKIPTRLKDLLNPTHDTFGSFHFRKQLITQENAAKQLNISKSDLVKVLNIFIRPKRVAYYQNRFELTPDEINEAEKILKSLTKLSTILSERKLSHFSFAKRFINTKFVSVIKLMSTEFLTTPDVLKVNDILDKYCNLSEASILLHSPSGTASRLLSQGKLTPIFLPGYNYRYPLVEIEEVNRLLSKKIKY